MLKIWTQQIEYQTSEYPYIKVTGDLVFSRNGIELRCPYRLRFRFGTEVPYGASKTLHFLSVFEAYAHYEGREISIMPARASNDGYVWQQYKTKLWSSKIKWVEPIEDLVIRFTDQLLRNPKELRDICDEKTNRIAYANFINAGKERLASK